MTNLIYNKILKYKNILHTHKKKVKQNLNSNIIKKIKLKIGILRNYKYTKFYDQYYYIIYNIILVIFVNIQKLLYQIYLNKRLVKRLVSH